MKILLALLLFAGGCVPRDPFPLPIGESSAEATPYLKAFTDVPPEWYQALPALQLEMDPAELDIEDMRKPPEALVDDSEGLPLLRARI